MNFNPNSEKGRCISCGFFAQQVTEFTGSIPDDMWKLPPEQYREVEMGHRQDGTFQGPWPRGATSRGAALSLVPVCFRRHFDLNDEINKESLPNRHEEVLAVTQKDRKCPKWYPYTPGLGPKESYERMRMDRLERESAQRDTRAFRIFVIIGIVGLILAGAAVYSAFKGTNVEVTVNIPTPAPTQSVSDTPTDLIQEAE